MPATYPQLASAAGTTLKITTLTPDSHDVAGFDGVADATTAGDASTGWVEIGAITNPGSLPRPVREFKDVDLLSGTTLVIPQTERMDSFEVEAVDQTADDGQSVLAAVSDGKTMCWFKWEMPNGNKLYCAGFVTGFGPEISSPNDEILAKFTVKPLSDENGVGPVRSNA